jgi:flagellar biosynthesis/type III secretory pathway protein FliH
MREALQRLVPGQTERIMQKWTQTYFDQGKAEGRTEGLTEGRTEGRIEGGAKMLVRVIEKRFGVVSPQLRQRIFSADVATLEAWVERLLDAPDLQSVFESN